MVIEPCFHLKTPQTGDGAGTGDQYTDKPRRDLTARAKFGKTRRARRAGVEASWVMGEVQGQSDRARVLRQKFYHDLLNVPLEAPDLVLQEIADAWRAASSAQSALVWLYNSFRGEYQLNAVSSDRPAAFAAPKPPSRQSLCAYAAAVRQPVLLEDVESWKGELGGVEYRAETCDLLIRRLECRSACCIPLLQPENGQPPDANGAPGSPPPCFGIVSLHYPSVKAARPEILDGVRGTERWRADQTGADAVDHSLILMGRLTASIITNLRLAEQHRTSVRLARLAERHLTRYSEDPKQIRKDYLNDVILLVRDQLKVAAVSIFCRVPLEDRIICIASTGLKRRSDGRILLKNELADAEYKIGEGRTGAAFQTGKHQFIEITDSGGRFVEVTEEKGEPISGLLLIHPILQNPGDPDGHQPGPPLGVIRCAHHTIPAEGGNLLKFDIVELKTLAFIIEQISPVLHTLESRIQREDLISIVKHDLLAPLSAIRDAVDQICDAEDRGRRADDYYLDNLRETALRLAGLTELLARDPVGRRQIYPEKTRLEGDIVAPMKRMLTPFASETSRMDIAFSGLDSLPALNIDRTLIERALYNLIVNAIKYGHRESTIRIRGQIVPGGIAVDVSNRGEGVEPASRDKIFLPYYRSPRARGTRMGEGLGLSVVKGIMKSHGGDVILEDPGDPTVFRLFFPDKLRAER